MSYDNKRPNQIRALVVHEWFASIGGSENVAKAICQAFNGADLLCLWRDKGIAMPESGRTMETMLSSRPFHGRKVLSLPLMPFVWRMTQARAKNWDIAIVSSHLFAHHVAVASGMPKFLYVHTPARYIWEPDFDKRGDSFFARAVSAVLKPLDRHRAQEAVSVAANSHFVRERIRKNWGLDARVIYPPVDVAEIRGVSDWSANLSDAEKALLEDLPSDYIMGASRFIPYKRLDLAIRAGELTRTPVVIAGAGPEEQRLRDLAATAGVRVYFILSPSNGLLRALYQRAAVFVFPPVEDFGIMPVEAIAAGTPVVSNSVGGASESVVEGITGAHFRLDDDSSLMNAITRARALDRTSIAEHSEQFSREEFDRRLHLWIAETLEMLEPVSRPGNDQEPQIMGRMNS